MLDILGLLLFHINFRIGLLIATDSLLTFLLGLLGRTGIMTILSLHIHLKISLDFFHQNFVAFLFGLYLSLAFFRVLSSIVFLISIFLFIDNILESN